MRAEAPSRASCRDGWRERVPMLVSGVEWEPAARRHGYQEYLGEFLSCLWVSVGPYHPPKRRSQLGVVDSL